MKYLLLIFFLSLGFTSNSQKKYTLTQAEQLLQKNNLLLLAEQYNISASQAAVIQAKIWDLPYLSLDVNAINPEDKRLFDIGANGQKGIAIQQLIYLGGKKKHEVEFAKSNAGIAQLQFEQLLRNLKHQLAQTFYSLYYDSKKIELINSQLEKLDTLVNNYQAQSLKGNIPLKEVVRLQALTVSLRNEKSEVEKNILDAKQTLLLLTNTEDIIPACDGTALFIQFTKAVAKDSIISNALANNLEYATAQKIAENQALYVKWQKSLAVPDLTAGASYDQRGGAFQNQVNLTLGIPLTLWNKNKGNIKIAESQAKQATVTTQYKKLEIESKAQTAYELWAQQKTLIESLTPSVSSNFLQVYQGVISNFQKRNISILEFTDFMESYNLTNYQINEITKNCILAGITINHITNKNIF